VDLLGGANDNSGQKGFDWTLSSLDVTRFSRELGPGFVLAISQFAATYSKHKRAAHGHVQKSS